MWGKNHFGQLGIPLVKAFPDQVGAASKIIKRDFNHSDPQHYSAPVEATLDLAVIQASCGEEHTAMLTKRGVVFMVGSNATG